MPRWLGLMPLLVAASAACGNDLAPRDQIADLRVLAIRAEPPMVQPGDTVVLDALVADPAGEPLTYRWSACAFPENFGSYAGGGGDGFDFLFCADLEEQIDLGTNATANLTVPTDFLTANQRVFDTLYGAGLPDEAVQALLAIGGLHMRINLVVETPSGQRIDAFKRLVVSPIGTNANPAPPAMFLGPQDEAADAPATGEVVAPGECIVGAPSLQALQTGAWTLTPVNLPTPPEEYAIIDFQGNFTTKEETYYWSWYTTVNGLRDSRTKSSRPENDLSLGAGFDRGLLFDIGPDRRGLPVWIVVRDGRGGTGWCQSVIPFDEAEE